jgi:hypothetical protein
MRADAGRRLGGHALAVDSIASSPGTLVRRLLKLYPSLAQAG